MGFRGGGGAAAIAADLAPATGPITVGQPSSPGTAKTIPHSDHVHAFPAAPANTTSTSIPGAAVNDGASSAAARADHVHAREIGDRGPWATGTTYLAGDRVVFGGLLWVCVTAHTAGASFAYTPTWVPRGPIAAYHLTAYGAALDGVTDDSTAWNAIAAAISSSAQPGVIVGPAGAVSLINATVTLPAHTTVAGPMTVRFGPALATSSTTPPAMFATTLVAGGSSTVPPAGTLTNGIRFVDLIVDANTPTSNICFFAGFTCGSPDQERGLTLERCRFINPPNTAGVTATVCMPSRVSGRAYAWGWTVRANTFVGGTWSVGLPPGSVLERNTFQGTSTAAVPMTIVGSADVEIVGNAFDGRGGAAGQIKCGAALPGGVAQFGPYQRTVPCCVVADNTIVNGTDSGSGSGIYLASTVSGQVSIVRNHIANIAGTSTLQPITFAGTADVTIADNRLTSCSTSSAAAVTNAAIVAQTTGRLTIARNYIDAFTSTNTAGWGSSIQVLGIYVNSASQPAATHIVDNFLSYTGGGTTEAVFFDGISNAKVRGNWLTGWTDAGIRNAAGGSNLEIDNNNFYAVGGENIILTAGSAGAFTNVKIRGNQIVAAQSNYNGVVTVRGAVDVVIAGNQLVNDNGSTTNSTGHIALTNCQRAKIDNNYVQSTNASSNVNGIYLDSTTAGVFLTHNLLVDNITTIANNVTTGQSLKYNNTGLTASNTFAVNI